MRRDSENEEEEEEERSAEQALGRQRRCLTWIFLMSMCACCAPLRRIKGNGHGLSRTSALTCMLTLLGAHLCMQVIFRHAIHVRMMAVYAYSRV